MIETKPQAMRIWSQLGYMLMFWAAFFGSGMAAWWVEIRYNLDVEGFIFFVLAAVSAVFVGMIFAFFRRRRFMRAEKWKLGALCTVSIYGFFALVAFLTPGMDLVGSFDNDIPLLVGSAIVVFLGFWVLISAFAGLGSRLVAGFRVEKPSSLQDVFE